MNNKLLMMQEMLMESMKRLSEDLSEEEIVREVARSNALSGNATTIIKSINIGLRVLEISQKTDTTVKKLNENLGIEHDEK